MPTTIRAQLDVECDANNLSEGQRVRVEALLQRKLDGMHAGNPPDLDSTLEDGQVMYYKFAINDSVHEVLDGTSK